MLKSYAGEDTDKTRIVLLSDGKENTDLKVANVLPSIIDDKIKIDTIIYG